VDSLAALTVFVRAADTRSFTAAGRQLGVSSSAVGKAVARLEDRLGVRLFHRSTRSIALTQEGALFLESCRRIFLEIEAVEREFAQSTSKPAGKLRVSAPVTVALVLPAITGFMRAFPDIHLDINFTDDLVDVIEGGYDVVIRTGEGVDSRLTSRKLGTYKLLVVGSPDYLDKTSVPATPDDLVNHSCMHHRYPTSGKLQRWPFRLSDDGQDTTLPIHAAVTTIQPLIAMAELGLGLVCVPDFAVRRQLTDGSLVSVLEDHLDHSGVFRAVWPSSRHLPSKTRAFIDYLAANLFAPQDAGAASTKL
jgi:DNA-binding transcriptional LysR family regulator